jgi:hypothetical protein
MGLRVAVGRCIHPSLTRRLLDNYRVGWGIEEVEVAEDVQLIRQPRHTGFTGPAVIWCSTSTLTSKLR